MAAVFVVLGNQLFAPELLTPHVEPDTRFFMAEDRGLCTYVKHHQQKLLLFLAAMRSHADALRRAGFEVAYDRLEDQDTERFASSYEDKLGRFLDQPDHADTDTLRIYEVEDKFFEDRIESFAETRGLKLDVLASPMFLTPRDTFAEYLDDADGKPYMARFYQRQRKRLGVMVDAEGKPEGGQWSFDGDNRKKLPKDVPVPEAPHAGVVDHVQPVKAVIRERFADHPGVLTDDEDFWLPTTRPASLAWLDDFLEDRFERFGDYEDALSNRGPVLFHAAISPMINLGLLTPDEVVQKSLTAAEKHGVPLNSLEGFIRQVIGWREFIRGVYQHFSEEQEVRNFWGHRRKLKACWYEGTTGMPPLDDVIAKCNRLGWAHHIERLMVVGNLLNLCEVEPGEAHRWFMEMFVDSSDWVMGPNVYGMCLMSDGGVFATKPYIGGSNYIVKMSDYKKDRTKPGEGWNWCDAWDGLYWRFVRNHRPYFEGNYRMAKMVGTLDRMGEDRRSRILEAAEVFIDRVTHA